MPLQDEASNLKDEQRPTLQQMGFITFPGRRYIHIFIDTRGWKATYTVLPSASEIQPVADAIETQLITTSSVDTLVFVIRFKLRYVRKLVVS